MGSITRVVYVARHGETDWNAAGRWQGRTDVPLNDNGRAQARALATRVRGLGVAALAASDLSRARETAEIVSRAIGATLSYVDADLRERGFGVFEGRTREECAQHHPEAWARYVADPRNLPPGGERQEQLVARMLQAVRRAATTLANGAPALVVSHGGAIRALVGAVRAQPIGPVANVAVVRVEIADDRFVDARLVD